MTYNSLGYFWYVYKTTCGISGKVYVGVHKAKKIPNNYIGCGVASDVTAKTRALKIKSPFVQAVAKYGYKNFNKEILNIINFMNLSLLFINSISLLIFFILYKDDIYTYLTTKSYMILI